jgi:hypothetical protein
MRYELHTGCELEFMLNPGKPLAHFRFVVTQPTLGGAVKIATRTLDTRAFASLIEWRHAAAQAHL